MSDRPDPASLVIGHLAELQHVSLDEWTDGPVADLAARVQHLRRLQSAIRLADKAIEDTLVGAMETDVIDVPYVGRLTRVERTQATWRDGGASERMRDDLARAVAQTVAIDIATGEVDPMKRNVALHTMRTAYEVIPSFSSLLKAGRDRLGLHIGDYRSYSTHYTISIEEL